MFKPDSRHAAASRGQRKEIGDVLATEKISQVGRDEGLTVKKQAQAGTTRAFSPKRAGLSKFSR